MFKVIQMYDMAGEIMEEALIRTVVGVDRATESFLVVGSFNSFVWIPIDYCRPYIQGMDRIFETV